MIEICENLDKMRDFIDKLNSKTKLMAVSKNFSYEYVKKAYECGQRMFGENRVQEALEKIELSKKDGLEIKWHLIGHLQSNKSKKAVFYFDCIDSVDSIELAELLDKYAKNYNKQLNIMLEVNVANDPKKFGFSIDDTLFAAAYIADHCKYIKLTGLMCIAPQSDEHTIRLSFRKLKVLFDEVNRNGVRLSELSMGMSDDYKIAIKEGSTIIRIGRGIFGRRV